MVNTFLIKGKSVRKAIVRIIMKTKLIEGTLIIDRMVLILKSLTRWRSLELRLIGQPKSI